MNRNKTKTNTLYLPKEKIWVNPDYFELVTEQDINNEIPGDIEEPSFRKIYGDLTKLSKQDPVSNTPWDYIRFKDVSIFQPAANAFRASEKAVAGTSMKPSYTPTIKGTIMHENFWFEELKRIIHGYEPIVNGEPCGIRISGEFYFYLNYCVMDKMEKQLDAKGKIKSVSVRSFPDFLAMDYYYFKELDARERPHLYGLDPTYQSVGITIAKSRRKGFSFKAASGAVWVTAFPKSSATAPPKVLIASDTGRDATLCFKKCVVIIDWLTDFTPFGRLNPGSPKDNGGWKHIQMSQTEDSGIFTFGLQNTKTGQRRGRLSIIATVSLNTRPDKAAGEGADRVYFEEAGKTEKLKDAWEFTRPVLKPGATIKGIAIIFGTGGSMVKDNGEKGHSRDFSELFNEPRAAELASFDNIYEYEYSNKKAGWFVPEMWACFGAYVVVDGKRYEALDDNGNAYFWVAELHINKERKIKKEHGQKEQYDKFLTQYCKTPSEAFLVTKGSIFPTSDLMARDTKIRLSKAGYSGIRTKGTLIESDGVIHFKPDLDNLLNPIDTFVVSSLDREGCILRYEAPMKLSGKIPNGAYIISVDPIGQNTVGGASMTSIIVVKTPMYAHRFGPEKVVCTYRGRAHDRPQQHVHEMLLKLSKYYNAKITFENDRDGGILQYFIRKKELSRLMSKPELTISKFIPGSKTLLREYGHSMGSSRHKRIGEDLLLEWLLKRQPNRRGIDEEGNVIDVPGFRNLDLLEDRALIEELIHYNRSGNFDVVMAMMGAIIQLNEHWNEDFLDQRRENEDGGNISDFWENLYVDNYGSSKEKMILREKRKTIERQRNRSNRDNTYGNDYDFKIDY